MNTFQRIPGPATCDTVVDADGYVTHVWRPATPAEVRSLQSPEGNPNHPAYADRIFGYETQAFLRKQYK